MQRALELACNGMGQVSPNPLVGAVLVYDGRIIGEGWHRQYGGPHAEVNAIASVKDTSLLAQSTLHVTLEPCDHHGKTPPCTELILQHKIPQVVVACTDPNPLVAGKGIAHLRSEGVEVLTGVMEAEAVELNKRFITFHQKKRPYIILKFAQTADGFLGKNVHDVSAADYRLARQISGDAANRLVHKWRSEEQAILIGAATAVADDPKLNVRLWTGNDPLRVVLCADTLPGHLQLLNDGQPTVLVAHKQISSAGEQVKTVIASENVSLVQAALNYLYTQNKISVLVEGGAKTLQQFLSTGLWDEARVFTSQAIYGSGIAAPQIGKPAVWQEQVGSDQLKVYRNNNLL